MQHESGQYCTVYRTPGSQVTRSEHDIDHVAKVFAVDDDSRTVVSA